MNIVTDPLESAKAAGLRYVSDDRPGIQRRKAGAHFRYVDAAGRPVREDATLRRIKSLAIPPAWTRVWICPLAHGHLQATGRDAKGRKQYRYHPRWREVRDETKYHRMLGFAQALPKIRARVHEDLTRPGLPREKVLATVVRLLETTRIRVGNEEYAKANKSFGLTTLKDRHAEVNGATVRFHFRGKSGVEHDIDVRDRRLAKIVMKCQSLPGHELFQFLAEDGTCHTIESGDVNDYLRAVAEDELTAKDFRTWAGTVLAAMALDEMERFDSLTAAKRNVMDAIKSVAQKLGNTPSVCRKCYVHPAVIDGYMDGHLLATYRKRARAVSDGAPALRAARSTLEDVHALRPEEAAVVAFLEERLTRAAAAE